jgi:hypothetical protein
MLAWMPQTYVYVPGVANVRVYVAPVASVGLPVVPSSHFTLCAGASLLVQVTVAPDFTVRLAGANAKFWIATASDLAGAWLAAGLAATLAAGLGAATLAAGLGGAAVGLAAPLHAASATLAEMTRPVISARCMGFPSGSMRGGRRQPGARPRARILCLGTPAECLPVSGAMA